MAAVRARVADEHVVGIVRHVGPVPTYPVVARLLAETHASNWKLLLPSGHHEDRTPMHGHEPTREAAMAAFTKSWRWE